MNYFSHFLQNFDSSSHHWIATEAAVWVSAIATVIYGFAAGLLWWENRRDRLQREKRYEQERQERRTEAEAQKKQALYSAYFEAWGYYTGLRGRSGGSPLAATEAGRVLEALVKLESLLRTNGYEEQANKLGFDIRARFTELDETLASVGAAIELTPQTYRDVRAVTPATARQTTR